MDTCANDPSKSSTEKKNEHEMCGYSLFTDCSFDKKNNKLDYYRAKGSNEDDTIIYRIKIIDSFRFMSTSLSTLVDSLSSKRIENGKCASCKSCLEFIKIRNSGRLIFECFDCKRRYQKDINDETLKKF